VKYCPEDGLFRPKHVGNIVNTSYLINTVHVLVLHHCSLMFDVLKQTFVAGPSLAPRGLSGTIKDSVAYCYYTDQVSSTPRVPRARKGF
jgi:hypothetical protein